MYVVNTEIKWIQTVSKLLNRDRPTAQQRKSVLYNKEIILHNVQWCSVIAHCVLITLYYIILYYIILYYIILYYIILCKTTSKDSNIYRGKTHAVIRIINEICKAVFFLWRNSPRRAQAASLLRFLDLSQSHTHARAHTHTAGTILWRSDQLVREVGTYTIHNKRTSVPSTGFKPVIPAINGPAC
jgi:hypothetical protein